MCREELLVRDIDVEQATRAMFRLAQEHSSSALADTAGLLFADTVSCEEYAAEVKPDGDS